MHVPTKVGCDLLASALLPFGDRLAPLETFFRNHPEARALRTGKSLVFQALSLLVEIWPVGITRGGLMSIFSEWVPRNLDGFRASRDPIQLVNKASQRGIQDSRADYIVPDEGTAVVYRIPVPIRFTAMHLALRDGGELRPVEEVAKIKEWMRKTFIEVPDEAWEKGHRNPDLPASAEGNLVMQPPGYNGPLRDRFIFDERGLIRCPTPREFSKRLREYVGTEEAARQIVEAIFREYPGLIDERSRAKEDR